jgi:hypothetical protein
MNIGGLPSQQLDTKIAPISESSLYNCYNSQRLCWRQGISSLYFDYMSDDMIQSLPKICEQWLDFEVVIQFEHIDKLSIESPKIQSSKLCHHLLVRSIGSDAISTFGHLTKRQLTWRNCCKAMVKISSPVQKQNTPGSRNHGKKLVDEEISWNFHIIGWWD